MREQAVVEERLTAEQLAGDANVQPATLQMLCGATGATPGSRLKTKTPTYIVSKPWPWRKAAGKTHEVGTEHWRLNMLVRLVPTADTSALETP